MAQTIKLKRSATSGAIPSTASLELGEVAINTYDGKMYIKKNVGGTETVVEVGAGAGGGGGLGSVSYLEAGMIEYEYTATLNQTTFSGADDNSATLSYTAESILVFLNGILQDDGVDYTATNGTSVVFSVGLAAADEVRIVSIANVTTLSTLNNPTKLDAISTVDGQAAYSLTLDTSAYTPSSETALIVSLNGITQEPGNSFTTSDSTITFAPALVTGDVIDYIVDMGRAVPIGEYSGDLAVGGDLTVGGDSTFSGDLAVGGESTFSGDIIMSGFPESIYELKGDLDGGIRFTAQAGEALSKGDIVYISGAAGANTIVSKAQANSSSTMPAFGFALTNASNGASCQIVTFGNLYGSGGAPLDTSAFNVGDTLYVSATTAGGFTSTPPTGENNLLQNIGKIVRSNSNNGVIKVGGAGRTNAVPNLDDGDIFIGNASNQAVTTTLDTSIVPENTNLYYTDARVDSRLASGNVGNIVTTGYLRGPATFTIDPAAHGDNTGTLVVAGNLQVDGTTTTINSTTMTVDDLNITLASGAANAAAANGAGITVDGASATLTYNSTPDAWSFNKNVGIGTDSPSETLQVENASNNAILLNAPANRYNSIGFQSAGTDKWWLGRADTDQIAGDAFFIGADNGNATDAGGLSAKLVINSSGNVGINNPSPTYTLDVTNNSSAYAPSARFLSNGDAANWARVDIENVNAGVPFILYQDNGGAVGVRNEANQPMFFSTNAQTRMTIGASGYVGIGQSNPQVKLQVKTATATNETAIRLSDDVTQTLNVIVDGTATTGGIHYQNPNAGYQRWSTSGIERMRIDSSGKVGIGTLDPANTLSIKGSVNQLDIETTTEGVTLESIDRADFAAQSDISYYARHGAHKFFGASYLERMRIDSNGNVGIGTRVISGGPASTLHVHSSVSGAPVPFGSESRITVSTNDTAAGNQGFLGSLFFGGQDVSSEQTAFTGAGVVGYAAGDLAEGNITADLLFYTQFGSNAPTEKMRIDSSGRVGIGITPNAWRTTDSVLQIGNRASVTGLANDTHFSNNAYFDAGTVWRAQDTAQAANYYQSAGIHVWRYAGTTTAGAAISWSEAMRIDSSGNVGIGTGDPAARLDVSTATGNTTFNVTNNDGFFQIQKNADDVYFNLIDTGNMVWRNGAGSATRMTLDANGSVTATGSIATTLDGDQAIRASSSTQSGWKSRIISSNAGWDRAAFLGVYNGVAGLFGHNNALSAWTDLYINTVSAGTTAANTYTGALYPHSVYSYGEVTAFSDERLKSDIETLDGSKVYEMRGVSYVKDGEASSGVIAQELQKVAPELVHESGEYLSVAYGNLVGYLIEAVKELKAEIDELKGVK